MVPFLTALRPPSLIVMFGWLIIIFPVKFSSVCVRIHGWSYPQVLLERRSEELGSSVDWRFHFFIGICHSFWRRRWSHRCSVQIWQMQIRFNRNIFVCVNFKNYSRGESSRENWYWSILLNKLFIGFHFLITFRVVLSLQRIRIELNSWVLTVA